MPLREDSEKAGDNPLRVVPFDRYRFELRLAEAVRFPFEHGGILRGLMSAVLDRHRLPKGLMPFACEAGRVSFEAGDRYALLVTLAGGARRHADDLIAGLELVGARRRHPSPVLGGNFVIESVTELPSPPLSADLDSLLEADEVELRLLSPLRMERPPNLRQRGATYLNRDCFPLDVFLDRLWRRLHFFQHGHYPEADERSAAPVLPERASCDPSELLWVDVPVRGTNAKGRPYTLGGVRGRIILRGLPREWLECLVVGAHLHVGKNTGYGLGRFSIVGTPSHEERAWRPAESLLVRARLVCPGARKGVPACLRQGTSPCRRRVCGGKNGP